MKRNLSLPDAPIEGKHKKPSIICNQITFKGDSNLHRICEEKSAKLFLCAIRLNLDEVYTTCSTYKTVEHIFTSDIVSHKNSIKRYLLQYQRNAEEIINYDETDDDSDIDVEEAFTTMLSQLHLETKGYTISACRDILNSKQEGYAISNRKVTVNKILWRKKYALRTVLKGKKEISDVLFY